MGNLIYLNFFVICIAHKSGPMTMIQLPWASDEVRTSFFYDWISILSKF